MFSVSSPCLPPPLPCSRGHVTEVAQSVHSFPYFQHILMDVSIWLYARKICLQCIPFLPGVSQLVYQLLPCGCEKTPEKSSVREEGYILAHISRAQPITVGKSWWQEFEGRGTARFHKRNGNRNCPDEEFRWSEERNGLRKAGACLNQGRSFDRRQNGQETGGGQTEVGQ